MIVLSQVHMLERMKPDDSALVASKNHVGKSIMRDVRGQTDVRGQADTAEKTKYR